MDVLFERRELFAADDDASDRLAQVELQKLGGGGATGTAADEHALAHDFHRQDAHVFLQRYRQSGLFEGGDRFHFALGDGVGGLGGVERHQDGVEVVAAQGFGHGGAVVVAGDADEANDFLFFQFLDCREDAVRFADAVRSSRLFKLWI